MSKHIAIVEDQKEIRELIAINFSKFNFIVHKFSFGSELLKHLEEKNYPDLIILDIMLPDWDGFELLKYLKSQEKYSKIPVIMLTARSDEADKVLGLEMGADDYVTKPFSTRELVARVKSVLRRYEKREGEVITYGEELVIDLDSSQVFFKGKELHLTTTEFKILSLLASRPGKVFSREEILSQLWGLDKDTLERTVDAHISNLRKKLGELGKLIKNVRGLGYKIEAR
ncbi:MAG: response regulator transcription factor [bacterium]|nr:response regulator transcription factor [bacterium]